MSQCTKDGKTFQANAMKPKTLGQSRAPVPQPVDMLVEAAVATAVLRRRPLAIDTAIATILLSRRALAISRRHAMR